MRIYFRVLAITLLSLNMALGSQAQSSGSSCTCECLKPLFDYLITSQRLFTKASDGMTLAAILEDARDAGYSVSYPQCAVLSRNINGAFYAKTQATSATTYQAQIGDCMVSIKSVSGNVTFYNLRSDACGTDGSVTYHVNGGSTLVARLQVDSCASCTPATTSTCVSAITGAPVNPYLYGLAGNWRPSSSYVYYSDRNETSLNEEAYLRKAGTIRSFSSFWKFDSNTLKMVNDTAQWVWNSQLTLVNRKGAELENKDPLGRYNAGIYGYDDALPVAVAQNARYREIAYEGFEDYDFGGSPCDAVCAVPRSFDFSYYRSKFDTTEQHTGKFSLRVDTSAGISAGITGTADDGFGLTFNKAQTSCDTSIYGLAAISTNANALITSFSPIAGKTIVVSAWVKESQDCQGTAYAGNRFSILVKQPGDSSTIIAQPKGAIIEGWQRYEEVVAVPDDAISISIVMQAIAGHAVYFDDIRIHPYNANMKSYVYNPSDLRLMAELDENNYATFYEYDDDGTLIRLKKETERGVKTITETRSALLKENTDR
ncbi:hypothetical protein [Chitinophaga ginsengisoli]|uniref:YD repeat-containing protein n=1 Tax=Chitinophaga ginsengisoli TaxID=363837 RepID=A0A2P8FDY3_9BACT|nr:hypothetical protein [Chitinophaga ginsengisoli]PSL19940.1 hypothetical protein CLV42_12653 [Chitinophaga ginsengisoli]